MDTFWPNFKLQILQKLHKMYMKSFVFYYRLHPWNFFLCWHIQNCCTLKVASVFLNLLEFIQFHKFHVQLKMYNLLCKYILYFINASVWVFTLWSAGLWAGTLKWEMVIIYAIYFNFKEFNISSRQTGSQKK